MDARDILAGYDEQMRRVPPIGPCETVERLPHVTRITDASGEGARNTVVFSAFDAAIADRIIDEQIAHYRALGREFEWKAGPQAVSAGWLRCHPDRGFGEPWGGSTLADHRRRGIYRAMVACRARAAHDRGVRFLAVDAGAVSRPILERLGFVYLATTVPCTLSPSSACRPA
jgi:hypothetical protein